MILLILFVTGLFAGTVDAIAGGGGLISFPILLSIGLPPQVALGTNKLQGVIGTFMATYKYYRHGLIAKHAIYQGIIFGLIGSVLGATSWQILSSDLLRKIIPFLLFGIFLYTLLSPKIGDIDRKPRLAPAKFYMVFGFALGFYDGFFGPGTGSLWVFALTFFLGYNLIKATAYTKLFNLNSSLIATLCFALGGNIDYRFALCMAAGQFIGGRLGAHLAITRGARLIRPLFLSVVSLTIASLLFKTYSTSYLYIRVTQQIGYIPQILFMIVILLSAISIYSRVNKHMQKSTATGIDLTSGRHV